MTHDLGPHVSVLCPTPACRTPTSAAVLCTIPASVGRYELIEQSQKQPGDDLYVCDECPTCGKRFCVKLLRAA